MPDNYFDFSSLKTTRNRPYDADNLNYIYGRLKERGYDDKHIAVLLGTIAEESGGNPYAVSPDGKFQGLLQWAGDRYAINPFMEENPKRELDRQIDYIARTIDNLDDSKSWTHGGKGSGYNRAADAHEAYVSSDSLDAINHAFNRGYVRPTGGDDSVANRYKVAEQVYNIITSGLPESVKAVNNSDAPFARDLRAGAKQRGYIKNADGSVSSYKMASGADDIGPYVFPVIQRDENGVLRDYSMPPYKAGYAQQRAEETGNLVRVPTDEDAQWFAEDNYKRFYDVSPVNAYPDGGTIEPAVKMAYAPDIRTAQGKAAARNMAEAIAAGQYKMQNTPVSYRNYISGELAGMPVTRAIGNAGDRLWRGSGESLDSGALGFMPVVGDALQAGQAVRDASQGNYLAAALGAGMLVLPDVVAKPIKKAMRSVGARKLAKAMEKGLDDTKATNDILRNYTGSVGDDVGVKIIGDNYSQRRSLEGPTYNYGDDFADEMVSTDDASQLYNQYFGNPLPEMSADDASNIKIDQFYKNYLTENEYWEDRLARKNKKLNSKRSDVQLRDLSEEEQNREFLKDFNRTFARRYHYEPIPLNYASDTQKAEGAVKNLLQRHNRVVRGVSDFSGKHSQVPRNVRQFSYEQMKKLGMDSWDADDRLRYAATVFAPSTGYGRAGLNDVPLAWVDDSGKELVIPKYRGEEMSYVPLGAHYASNSIGTGKGYTYNNGKIALLEYPFSLGDDRMLWKYEADPIVYNSGNKLYEDRFKPRFDGVGYDSNQNFMERVLRLSGDGPLQLKVNNNRYRFTEGMPSKFTLDDLSEYVVENSWFDVGLAPEYIKDNKLMNSQGELLINAYKYLHHPPVIPADDPTRYLADKLGWVDNPTTVGDYINNTAIQSAIQSGVRSKKEIYEKGVVSRLRYLKGLQKENLYRELKGTNVPRREQVKEALQRQKKEYSDLYKRMRDYDVPSFKKMMEISPIPRLIQETGRNSKKADDAFTHLISIGPVGTPAANFVEWLNPNDFSREEIGAITRQHYGTGANFLSRNTRADGGSINIKPENRGKFTALKERTGHSASWFKENGTPAQRKMATFELNSKKWKH